MRAEDRAKAQEALGRAVARDDATLALFALTAGADPLEEMTIRGGVPPRSLTNGAWFLAAVLGSAAVLRVMLRRGVDVNAEEPLGGMTALHYSASALKLSAVETLLAAGCSVMPSDRSGLTPLARVPAGPDHDPVLVESVRSALKAAAGAGYRPTLEGRYRYRVPSRGIDQEVTVERRDGKLAVRLRPGFTPVFMHDIIPEAVFEDL